MALEDYTVVSYYSAGVGSVEQEQAPERVRKGLDKHSIPIMPLARLTVDRHWQNQRIGAALVKDAVLRTLQAADIAGIRARWSMPKMRRQVAFTHILISFLRQAIPLHLFMLLKDARRIAFRTSCLRLEGAFLASAKSDLCQDHFLERFVFPAS